MLYCCTSGKATVIVSQGVGKLASVTRGPRHRWHQRIDHQGKDPFGSIDACVSSATSEGRYDEKQKQQTKKTAKGGGEIRHQIDQRHQS